MLTAFVLAAAVTSSAVFQPPDDPGFGRCIDPGRGIRLEWRRPDDAVTYVLVKRLDGSGRWRPWLKTRRADPPFTLTMQGPLARHGRFAWMLFDVEGGRLAKGAWHYFCTEEPGRGGAPGNAPSG